MVEGFKSDGRLFDLPFGIIRIGFNLDAGDLLDVARLAAQGDPPVFRRLDDRAIRHACRQHER